MPRRPPPSRPAGSPAQGSGRGGIRASEPGRVRTPGGWGAWGGQLLISHLRNHRQRPSERAVSASRERGEQSLRARPRPSRAQNRDCSPASPRVQPASASESERLKEWRPIENEQERESGSHSVLRGPLRLPRPPRPSRPDHRTGLTAAGRLELGCCWGAGQEAGPEGRAGPAASGPS